MGTTKDFMVTLNHFATAYLNGTEDKHMRVIGQSSKPILLESNKPINKFGSGNFFDSLRFALDQRFYSRYKKSDGSIGYKGNEPLLSKVGATRKVIENQKQTDGTVKDNVMDQWEIGDKQRLQSLMYDRDGKFAYARMATAGMASGFLGLSFLSDITTMRHAAGIPYI